MKFLNVILIVYSLLITNVFGATITDDTLKIGKPGSSANKEITLGTTKKIRANESTGKIEFSNDGSLYKNLGSGSGSGGSSGVNLVGNDSFEDGIGSPWTSSGGTFSQQTYTVGSEDDTKFARFIATTSGQYVEQIVSVKTNLGIGCQADFKKVNIATAGLFKVQALDVSNNVLAEQTIGVSAWIKTPTISFPCPAAGTNNLKLRLTSLAAGTIDFDKGYNGSNQNLVYTSQARLLGTVTVTGCTGAWQVGTTTSYQDYPAQTSCVYNTSGSALAPATMIPGIRFARLEAGDYRIEYEGNIGSNNSGSSAFFQFSDGVNTARETSSVQAGSTDMWISGISQTISYGTAQSNVTLAIRTKASAGSTFSSLYGTTAKPGVFKVWFFPAASEVAVSNEQSSWYIDASIGGGTPGSAITTTYLPFSSSTLDMVLNPGSATATIPCSGTNPDTGLTCAAGSEEVGVSFVPPSAGVYEACIYSTIILNGSNTSSYQWVETPVAAQTIIQEGKSKNGFSGVAGSGLSLSNCGTFTFNDTSKRTLRFSYESNSTQLTMQLDRDASFGQRDAHIIVRPLLSAFNRPVLTGDQIITPNTTKQKICAFGFGGASYNTACASGSCTIYQAASSCGVAVTRTVLGQYTYAFPAATWNGTNYFCGPVGVPTYASGTHAPNQYEFAAKTSTVVSATFNNTSGNSDVAANIICYGQGN